MISAIEALARLREGNRRFVDNQCIASTALSASRRATLVAGQEPFAIVLGCSDSRVPAELVFDQGLGDLFVIRVAGNIVAPSQVGSVEFAASRYGTRLVVVMGHSQSVFLCRICHDLTYESCIEGKSTTAFLAEMAAQLGLSVSEVKEDISEDTRTRNKWRRKRDRRASYIGSDGLQDPHEKSLKRRMLEAKVTCDMAKVLGFTEPHLN
jgi:carbonic anhydrase